MKSKIFFSLLAIGSALSAASSPITPEMALSRLKETGRHAKASSSPRLVDIISDEAGNPAIYHFTYSGDDGFMLLSADDGVAPLLGYSETNSFASGEIPGHISSWLSYYAGQISDAMTLAVAPWEERRQNVRAADKAPIDPLIKSRWDQGSPYNNLCPVIDSRRCVTGCVATAMAQVMNYWEYPLSGKGSVAYSPSTTDEDLFLDFSEITFDWANMLDIYGRSYSSTSAKAVATLMKACGYSVKMEYSPSASGARSGLIPNALKTYFGYDQGVTYKEYSNYKLNKDAWIDLVYDNLATIGPVIYSGQSSSGGHCFVCDGYDGKGYFHINWGWGGMSDGYFLLDELTPGEIGTGGHYGGYNMEQEVTVGIMPPVGRLSLVSTSIDNAADDTGNVAGWGKVYRINDIYNILLSVKLRVSGGHVSSPLYVSIYETDPVTKTNGSLALETVFDEPLNASDGVVTCSTSINFSNFNPSKFYTLVISYDLKGKKTTLESVRLAASSGVEDIWAQSPSLSLRIDGNLLIAEGEGETLLRVIDTKGRVVVSAKGHSPGAQLDGLASGIYIGMAESAGGEIQTLKIVRK